jgi:hypothetical protein
MSGRTDPAASQVNSLESFREALIDYFSVLNFVPILVDRGYTVGDVVEADGVNFMARSFQCFPTLPQPTAVSISLPSAVQTTSAGLSFGLKLKQIFDSSAGADLVKTIWLSFDSVTVASVTRFDLKQTLDRKACDDITSLVDGTVLPVDRNWKPRFVVSEVMTGKREATLTFADQANLKAKADKLAQEFGSAEVSVHVGTDGTVTLKSNLNSVIAVKPVTVPSVVLAKQFDQLRGANDLDLKWNPLECENAQSCKRLFDPFAELLKASKPKFDPSELEK